MKVRHRRNQTLATLDFQSTHLTDTPSLATSTSHQYLLQALESRQARLGLNELELKQLLNDVQEGRVRPHLLAARKLTAGLTI